MSGIEGAAIAAAVTLGVGAFNGTSGFSARHDHSYDAEAAETRRLIGDFEKLRKSGNMADEDYDLYLEKKGIAIQSSKAYRDTISEFKSTRALNPIKKWRKKGKVRERKRHAREANQSLQDHYYDSSSCTSDASSTTAESGSPPQALDIREWADGIRKKDSSGDDSFSIASDSSVDDRFSINSSEGEEGRKGYVEGGYHPVEIGDTFSDGRYTVVRKIGWGRLSTVWLATDQKVNRRVALKIIKSAPKYTEIAQDRIELLQRLGTLPIAPTASNLNPSQLPSQMHPGRKYLALLLDHFIHNGPNGVHVCMVSEVFGGTLRDFMNRYKDKGIPMPFSRQIAKQILLGLDYGHKFRRVIYADLCPESILVHIDDVESFESGELNTDTSMVSSDPQLGESSGMPEVSADKITVKLTGFTCNAKFLVRREAQIWDDIRKQQYRSPERILDATRAPSSDIWTLACILFELITGDSLFNLSGPPSEFDGKHITQIYELLGKIPKNIGLSGGRFTWLLTLQKDLKRRKKLPYCPLESVLHDKYSFPKVEAEAITAFLAPMIILDPGRRASVSELIHHNWLAGLTEQSELDATMNNKGKAGDEAFRVAQRRRLRNPIGTPSFSNDGTGVRI